MRNSLGMAIAWSAILVAGLLCLLLVTRPGDAPSAA